MIETTAVSRRAWLRGEALCPSCKLPIDGRDVAEDAREAGESQPSGAVVTHKRCGAMFRVRLPK